MANVSTDILSLVECSKRKVVEMNDFESMDPSIQDMATQLMVTQLNSLDLIECVINLADSSVADDVSMFLEMMTHKSPELVFVGLIQIQVKSPDIHDQACHANTSIYIAY
jgi:CCR4-NOT transcription complex subunit 1